MSLNKSNSGKSAIPATHSKTVSARRHDLDWLRVIAFGILIYFHTAVAFLPDGLPLTLNAQSSPIIGIGVYIRRVL